MSTHYDGGPAFPRPASEDTRGGSLVDGNELQAAQTGMSRRTWLAGHAPAVQSLPMDAEMAADWAVRWADAVLARLAEPKP